MDYRWVRAGFVLVSFSICARTGLAADKPAPQPVDGKIHWIYSLAEGQKIARETGKPMFVVFRCER